MGFPHLKTAVWRNMSPAKSCLRLLLCYASLLAAQTTRRPAPLHLGLDVNSRRNGSYIIKLKDTVKFDDLGRLAGELHKKNLSISSDSSLSIYFTVGLGVIAKLDKATLEEVSIDKSYM